MSENKPHCLECGQPMPFVSKEDFEKYEIFCSLDCEKQYLGDDE